MLDFFVPVDELGSVVDAFATFEIEALPRIVVHMRNMGFSQDFVNREN